MLVFTTEILKFAKNGEKTGWTYINIPAEVAAKLKPGNKLSFRAKGKLDAYEIKAVALLPIGEGNFIMALNATIQKGIKKRKGACLQVQLEIDNEPLKPNAVLMECLADEPAALAFFNGLTMGHRNYFTKWIAEAKTDATTTKRIAEAVTAFCRKQGFPEMVRANRKEKI